MSVLDTFPDSKEKRRIVPKTRIVRRFAWLPTIIFNDFATRKGRYEIAWFSHYSSFEQWTIIGSFSADIYAEAVWGWAVIGKYKI